MVYRFVPRTTTPMELYMYFNEDLVDSLCLDEERISQPGYIGQKKRYLLKLHKSTVNEKVEPLFYIQKSEASLPAMLNLRA
jgi:hypothetical protein